MAAANRQVGSLWCFDVLAKLSDYVDGELSADERAQVEVHLASCDECTRFGGEFGQVVTALRAKLGVADDVPAEVGERLNAVLSVKR